MLFASEESLIKKYTPIIEIRDKIPIPEIDIMQLNIAIFKDKSPDRSWSPELPRHWVILLPPKNWIAPSSPPLWISSPEMPILNSKDEPELDINSEDWSKIILVNTIKKVGKTRKNITKNFWFKLFTFNGKYWLEFKPGFSKNEIITIKE